MNSIRLVDRWRRFVNASPLRRLGHNAMVAAMTSLAARAVGFVKEIIVAAHFGLSGDLDVYLVAFTLIGFPLAILLNAIQTTTISSLSACQSAAQGKQIFSLTATGLLLAMAAIIPLWMAFLPYAMPWLASGFPAEKQHALELALRWLVPYYFVAGINLLGYGALQAKGKYLLNGLMPGATPLVTMLMVLLAGLNAGWHVLAAALVIGNSIECVLLLIALNRAGMIGVPDFSQWKLVRPVFSGGMALLPATFAGACVMVVEQAIAASLGEGSNASLAYGYRLPTTLQSLFVTAIGITTLPYFSLQISNRQYSYCLHSLKRLIWLLGIGGGIVSLVLIGFSSELVSIFYQRGVFDAEAVARVSPIQAIYFFQIPFSLLGILGYKVMTALGRNSLVSIIVSITSILQCSFAYELAHYRGVTGIAWAAVISSTLIALTTCASTIYIFKRYANEKDLLV